MKPSLVDLKKEGGYFLIQLGFTKTQAHVYLTLLEHGSATASALSKNADVPRAIAYRTLDELQAMGVVEKEITAPFKFSAVPLEFGLQVLMLRRLQQQKDLQEKAKEFIRSIKDHEKKTLEDNDYKFIIIQSRERILQRIKFEHANVQVNADIISTPQRLLQIMECCLEYYEEALERGVEYRVLLEKPESKFNFPKYLLNLMSAPNFKLRFSKKPLITNAGIFDKKEATFNFYPSKTLKESPIIWTNHPSFLSMFKDHFRNAWKLAIPFEG